MRLFKPFKMALKFKPVVVTAVLFKLDPLFSVKKNYGLSDSYARVLAFLEFCSHEQSSLSNGCCFSYKMPAIHESWFKFGTAG